MIMPNIRRISDESSTTAHPSMYFVPSSIIHVILCKSMDIIIIIIVNSVHDHCTGMVVVLEQVL